MVTINTLSTTVAVAAQPVLHRDSTASINIYRPQSVPGYYIFTNRRRSFGHGSRQGALVVRCHSSTPAVVRCVVSVGGAVWVEKHGMIYYSPHRRPSCFPHGYILGNTPSQYCTKTIQQNRVVLALQILQHVFSIFIYF